jgi:hypothetical protein
MWAAVPVRKMCAYCLVDEPEWSHYELTRAAKLLGLARGDIGFFPVLFGRNSIDLWNFVSDI